MNLFDRILISFVVVCLYLILYGYGKRIDRIEVKLGITAATMEVANEKESR